VISLSPLPHARAAEVLHLEVADHQRAFVHPIADMVQETTRGVAMHVIRWNGAAIGFFKTDATYAERYDFAAEGEIGIRGVLIGAQYQGLGYGKAAMAALPGYLGQAFPEAGAAVLTVNCTNPTARRVYEASGWRDTGALYLGGNAGPQHIYRMELRG